MFLLFISSNHCLTPELPKCTNGYIPVSSLAIINLNDKSIQEHPSNLSTLSITLIISGFSPIFGLLNLKAINGGTLVVFKQKRKMMTPYFDMLVVVAINFLYKIFQP